MVKLLLKREDVAADLRNYYGKTLIFLAVTVGDEEMVKLLMERKYVATNEKDLFGQTPLSLAA